jgi:enamine deaminase RidA (YjgF/YER057c/UK114 family)
MFEPVDTGLAKPKGPVTGTVRSSGMVISAQIPKDASGEIVAGDITAQTRQIFTNLKQSIEAAGGTLRDVAHIFVHLVDSGDAARMNDVYREFFSEPYPCRCTVVVKELLAKNMRIELVAFANISG